MPMDALNEKHRLSSGTGSAKLLKTKQNSLSALTQLGERRNGYFLVWLSGG